MTTAGVADGAIRSLARAHHELPAIEPASGHRTEALVAYGWWSRIIRTAHAVAVLHDSGLAHESSPLVRVVLHHYAAMKWLLDEPDQVLEANPVGAPTSGSSHKKGSDCPRLGP